MNKLIESLSTRETAWVIWLLIAFIACMFGKDIRKSIFADLKTLLEWKILVPILLFFGHTALYVFILFKLGLWDISLLKDAIIWTLSFGFVSLMNINKVNETKYFKNILLDALKWTIAIEFIMNFFTFSLTKEIILVPVIVFSAMMQAAASFDNKHKQVETLFKNLLIWFSIFVFIFSLYKTFEKHSELFTTDNFKSFLLPVFLTITFLPFMYLFNLIAKYETLWLTLRFNIKNLNDRNRVKRNILLVANFNIDKVVNISKNIAKPINIYNDLTYEMVKKVSKGRYIGFDEQNTE
jgi:hypothetical protein